VALIERHLLGGTCVNTGCIPTKTLVAGAYAVHLARRSAEYGVMQNTPPRIDMARVKACADNVWANVRAGLERWVSGLTRCTVTQR
jgi:pyruvate/2-oxoglutarate dehydrogenase complex dihydrolipoamide dehydrogenase (E3) component